MKYIYTLALYFVTSFAIVIAAETAVIISSEEGKEPDITDKELNELLRNRLKSQALSAEEKKEKEYQELVKRYPDVVPPRRAQKGALGLSQLVYDVNFANTIFFSPGSSFITDVQQEKMRSILATMVEEPTFHLVIVGHSSFNTQIEDRNDRFYYNRWISGRRAVQVWNFFVKQGIEETRLAAFSKDSQEPLNGEESLREVNLNRRVELRLTNQPIALGSQTKTRKTNKSSQGRAQPSN